MTQQRLTDRAVRIEDVELFLIGNLKELPLGNGKYKLKAECSMQEFLDRFEDYCKQL